MTVNNYENNQESAFVPFHPRLNFQLGFALCSVGVQPKTYQHAVSSRLNQVAPLSVQDDASQLQAVVYIRSQSVNQHSDHSAHQLGVWSRLARAGQTSDSDGMRLAQKSGRLPAKIDKT